jgi:hypothetical protein
MTHHRLERMRTSDKQRNDDCKVGLPRLERRCPRRTSIPQQFRERASRPSPYFFAGKITSAREY